MEGGDRLSASLSNGSSRCKPLPHLVCERCRSRKIKCDKLDPCTNCVVADVICVPTRRPRLPRGRHVHPDGSATIESLRGRLQRLESIIDRISTMRRGVVTNTAPPSQRPEEQLPAGAYSTPESNTSPSPSSTMIDGPDEFWARLVEEVHGLRDVVSPAVHSGNGEYETAQETVPAEAAGVRILSPNRSSASSQTASSLVPMTGVDQSPAADRGTVATLCQVYLRQVDPVIKILHRPSINRWLVGGESYLAYPPGHTSTEALKTAVCYFAVCSMTDNQCQAELGLDRAALVEDWRRTCEDAIEASGLLTTRDTTVLQAFVLYLFARKINDRSQAVWTLVALAVRMAKGLHLNMESKKNESFFCQQLHRRLWYTICLLDLQTANLQVTQPLISGKEAASTTMALPNHINDADFGPDTTLTTTATTTTAEAGVPLDREEITDTTIALVIYRLQMIGRGLVHMPHMASRGGGDGGGDRPQAQAQWQQPICQFEDQAMRLLRFCDPESSPYAWFTWNGTHGLVYAAHLLGRQPVLLSLHRASDPEGNNNKNNNSNNDDDNDKPNPAFAAESLRLAIRWLEKTLLILTDPRGEGFRWYISVQWHGLVVAIADCYVCTDAALVRRAWPVIEALYQRHEEQLGRSRNSINSSSSGSKSSSDNDGCGDGRMLGPLAKLMRRTREKVAALLQTQPAETASEAAELLGTGRETTRATDDGDMPAAVSSASTPAATGGTIIPEAQLADTNWVSTLSSSQSLADPPAPATDVAFPSFREILYDPLKIWGDLLASVPCDGMYQPELPFPP